MRTRLAFSKFKEWAPKRPIQDNIEQITKRSIIAHLECLNEGLLRDFDLAELAHALLAFLLLFQKFALARHVAAVALRRHVLAQRRDRLARHDATTDGRLDRNLEHMLRDQFLELFAQRTATLFSSRAVHQHRQRIDRLFVDEDRHLDQIALAIIRKIIVERGIALEIDFRRS